MTDSVDLTAVQDQLALARAQTESEETVKARARIGNNFEMSRKHPGEPPAVSDVICFLAKDLENYAAATLWTRRSHIVRYIRDKYHSDFTHELGDIDSVLSRMSKVQKQRQATAFTGAQLGQWLAQTPSTGEGLRDKFLVLVGVFGLARSAELTKLLVSDVTVESDGLTVQLTRAKTAAATRNQIVRIPANCGIDLDIKELAQEYLRQIPTSGRLWRRWTGRRFGEQPLGVHKVRDLPKVVATVLQLDPTIYSGHSLRATGTTLLADAGATDKDLERAGNWTSPAAMARYVRNSTVNTNTTATHIGGQIHIPTTSPDHPHPRVESPKPPEIEPLSPPAAAPVDVAPRTLALSLSGCQNVVVNCWVTH